MPRRKADPDRNDSKPGGGDRRAHPFEALAELRRRQADRQTTRPTAAANADKRATPAAEDDTAAFRKALRDVAPLRDDGRKEIERPRPAPVPRPRPSEPEDIAPAASRRPRDPLSEAYADVTPLRNTNRVALAPAPARNVYRALDVADGIQDPSPDLAERALRVVLPPEAEHVAPAELFRSVMQDTRPIDLRNRVELARPQPAPAPLKREADERSALDESLLAPLTFEDRLDMGDEAAFLRPGLPRRVLSDLRRGRWTQQGEIDLHGYTREEAREALAHFLAASLQQGRRCIRVIHGKGLGSPGKVSILKQLSRGWLAQREEILAFCQAGPHDGGSGALLVLMRAPNAARR